MHKREGIAWLSIGLSAAGILVAASFMFLFQQPAKAGVGDNVSQWAWSGNIGWISFNCTTDPNGCGVDYGVNVNTTNGKFSKHAWAATDDPDSAIGWISFNRTETGTPPGLPYNGSEDFTACLDFSTSGQACDTADDHKVYGWARAISVCPSLPCATGDNEGGWDGWIKLRDAADGYGVKWNSITKELEGFAWGGEVIGMISFNNKDCDADEDGFSDGPPCPSTATPIPDYQVVLGANSPPTAAITCSAPCEAWKGTNPDGTPRLDPLIFTLTNNSSDPDDNIKWSRWTGMSPSTTCDEDVNNDGVTDDDNGNAVVDSGDLCNYTVQPTNAVGSHTVQLEVEDTGGLKITATQSVTIKQDIVADFECSLDGVSPTPCSSISVVIGQTIYFLDNSIPSKDSTIDDWDWDFGSAVATPATRFCPPDPTSDCSPTTSTVYNSTGPKTVQLCVTDIQRPQRCRVKSLSVQSPDIPFWKEIFPF